MSSTTFIDVADRNKAVPALSGEGGEPEFQILENAHPALRGETDRPTESSDKASTPRAEATEAAQTAAATSDPKPAEAAPATTTRVMDELKKRLPPAPVMPPLVEIGATPRKADFDDPESFGEALGAHGARLAMRQQQEVEWQHSVQAHKQAVAQAIDASWLERKTKAAEKYPDFEKLTGSDDLTITQVMADLIKTEDYGTDVAYHLGQNPTEAKRIASLDPVKQIAEISLIAHKLKNPETTRTPRTRARAPAAVTPEESMDRYAERRLAQLRERSRPGARWA